LSSKLIWWLRYSYVIPLSSKGSRQHRTLDLVFKEPRLAPQGGPL